MLDPHQHPHCSEFYTVEKSVEVEVTIRGEPRRIRIDALHSPTGSVLYSTRAYVEESVVLRLQFPRDGQEAEPFRVWVGYDLPWTHGTSADDVLDQALGFLSAATG